MLTEPRRSLPMPLYSMERGTAASDHFDQSRHTEDLHHGGSLSETTVLPQGTGISTGTVPTLGLDDTLTPDTSTVKNRTEDDPVSKRARVHGKSESDFLNEASSTACASKPSPAAGAAGN